MASKQPTIAYYRVSTKKQGESGLGLESQKNLVFGYLREEPDYEFTEIETGTNEEREQLGLALELTKKLKGRLIIANVSRLSRKASLVLMLQDSNVDFTCCDNPNANPLTIGILALVAQDYSDTLSNNTKNALGRLRERELQKNPNFRLGCPIGKSGFENENPKEGKMAASEIRALAESKKKERFEKEKPVRGLVYSLHQSGKSLGFICKLLNDGGFKTPYKDSVWTKATISLIIKRCKKELEKEVKI